jgi:hypothetical protein
MSEDSAIFISAAGLNAEYGGTYLDRSKPIEKRFNYFSDDMQQKFNVFQKIVLYTEQDMRTLLTQIGFFEVSVFSSSFGTVKAIGRKQRN